MNNNEDLQTVACQSRQQLHNSKLKEKLLSDFSQCNYRDLNSITQRIYNLPEEDKYVPSSKTNTVQRSLRSLIKEGKVLRIGVCYFKTTETEDIKKAINHEIERIRECERELNMRYVYYQQQRIYLTQCMEFINDTDSKEVPK